MSAPEQRATTSRRSTLGGAVGAGALGLVGAGGERPRNRRPGIRARHHHQLLRHPRGAHTRLHTGGTRRFTARHDVWRHWTGSDLTTVRGHYRATAANAPPLPRRADPPLRRRPRQPRPLDNLVAGTASSSVDSSSRAQVLHVQACCRYLWGLGTAIDDVWGSQTSSRSTRVLRAAGVSTGGISRQSRWSAFNRASMRKGHGTQSYPAA